ncbi:hypothetical protein Tco_1475784 [Tanacetum coccineum]
MSNMSEDIQYAGSDTRPPMLDRTDFESWKQRIRPERARVFTDLSAEEKERDQCPDGAYTLKFVKQHAYLSGVDSYTEVKLTEVIQPTNDPLALVSNAQFAEVLQLTKLDESLTPTTLVASLISYKLHLPQTKHSIESLIMQGTKLRFKTVELWFKMSVEDTMRIIKEDQFRGTIQEEMLHIAGECPRPKRLQDSDYFKDKMLLMQAQENGTTEELVGTSNVSSVRNDALMSIIDDMHDTAVVLKCSKTLPLKQADQSLEAIQRKIGSFLVEQPPTVKIVLDRGSRFGNQKANVDIQFDNPAGLESHTGTTQLLKYWLSMEEPTGMKSTLGN